MAEKSDSCTQPVRGPLNVPVAEPVAPGSPLKEDIRMLARVGKEAPDFEAMAYVDGGFKAIKLSDYAGHWIVLCFYPGDFTFV